MLKVILDTNVLVSALIQNSYPHLILAKILDNPQVEICTSEALFSEYLDVLHRKKFARFADFEVNARSLLVDIENYATTYYPTLKIDLISDVDDNKLLELADISRADYLVTGDRSDFTMKNYKKTSIVSPKDFWEILVAEK